MPEKPAWLTELFPWNQFLIQVNGRTMAYLDEGPKDARPVLLLQGNPTWGFLYRDFVAPLTAAGYRAIAPDWPFRVADHAAFQSAELSDHIRQTGVQVIGYRVLRDAMYTRL